MGGSREALWLALALVGTGCASEGADEDRHAWALGDAALEAPGPFSLGDGGPGDDATVRADGAAPRDACPDDSAARPNQGLQERVYDARCPAGMVLAGAVCVDRYEAFVDRVDDAGVTIASLSPYRPPPVGVRVAARSVAGAVPHGYISGVEAERACRGAGKRLCTSSEWLRACRGAAGNVYPYGNARRAGVCNDAYAAGHPAATCFATTASWIYSELDYAGINQQPGTVAPAGSYAGCTTSEGLFDMMGNLHEWVRDGAGTPPLAAVDFRGGFFADTARNGEGCLYATSAHGFSHWDYSTGFRCCADPR